MYSKLPFFVIVLSIFIIDTCFAQNNVKQSGGIIIYTADQRSEQEIFRINSSGENKFQLTDNKIYESNPIVIELNNEAHLLFHQFNYSMAKPGILWKKNIDGSTKSKIKSIDGSFFDWSHQKEKLALITNHDIKRYASYDAIFTVNADGADAKQIISLKGNMTSLAWAPNGKKIAFVMEPPNLSDDADLFLINADGSGLIQLVDAKSKALKNLSWHSNGDKIMFVRTGSAGAEICIINSDGTDLNVVKTPTTTIDNKSPVWSPDGSHLVYVDRSNYYTSIYLAKTDGSEAHIITPDSLHMPAFYSSILWSPDGSRIAFTTRNAIWSIKSDGSHLKKVTNAAFPIKLISWIKIE